MKRHSTPGSKNTKDSFVLVMPAYNEEKKIKKTIFGWKKIVEKTPGSQIIVVNDGSKDKTESILNNLTKKYKFLKVINKKNEGHGKTVYRAYKEALKTNHKWVFQTDSDGHFDPKDFFKLWEQRFESPFILGFRKGRQDPLFRILLSLIIRLYILIYFKLYIKDANIPFRLIEKNYLKKTLPNIPEGVFAPNILLSIFAARDGHKLFNIAVPHKNLGHNSHLNFKKLIKGALTGLRELQITKN